MGGVLDENNRENRQKEKVALCLESPSACNSSPVIHLLLLLLLFVSLIFTCHVISDTAREIWTNPRDIPYICAP